MNPRELYIGVDVHEKESQVAVYDPNGTLIEEKRLPTEKLPAYIASHPGEKHVALEAIGFIYPIHDALAEVGCDVAVANPHNIQLIAKTRIKHDKVDARVLGELLRTNFFPRSRIPDAETREKRLLVKDRVKYGVKRADLKNTVKWLLKRRGIKVKSPFSREGRDRLRSLGLREVEIRLRELELVDTIIEELDRRIRFTALRDHGARLLDTIPGVGPYTALYLSTALHGVERFPSSKQACAHVGLVPSLHQSGDKVMLGHITRQGDKWLRRNLVECARWSVRKDPHLKEFYLRVRHRKGRKKALVAVARKLVSYAYWMLKRDVTYEELCPWKTDWGVSP
jgi:transposase